jgi:hypothetical protein
MAAEKPPPSAALMANDMAKTFPAAMLSPRFSDII